MRGASQNVCSFGETIINLHESATHSLRSVPALKFRIDLDHNGGKV